MATDTVPAAVPGPPEPTGHTTVNDQPAQGFLASMVAPVQPARPTFDLTPTTNAGDQPAAADGALDRSTPGVSSASFRDADQAAVKDPAGEKRKSQGSVWKAWWLAGAQRWAKGGGAANKRLDMKKAQAQSHQVKENRTTTVTKSPGLPVRNSVGAGGGSKGNSGKSGADSRGKGPVNSSGNRSGGPGWGGSGGGRGSGGGSGSNGSGAGGRDRKDTGAPGKGGAGSHGTGGGSGTGGGKGSAGGEKSSKKPAPHSPTGKDKDSGKQPGTSTGGGAGKHGSAGKSGKDGAPGKAGTGPDTKGSSTKTDLSKDPKNSKTNGKDGAAGADGQKNNAAKDAGTKPPATEKTPLEKSRETGHGDGTKVRRAVDHVKAYANGTRDGWDDEKTKNAKEHGRLDKAHADHAKKDGANDKASANTIPPKPGYPPVAIFTEPEDDGVTTDVKPLTVKSIDANTLTLGADTTRTTYGRRELRNFKQYECKLEAKVTVLQKIAEACAQLQKEAEQEAKECQDLAEQAKSVKGGEKLVTQLNKLAEAAKNQAVEAAELTKRAKRAAEMCKVVHTNIQTRYAPLYKAVVDSGEIKPAEMRFYNDKGVYATAA